MSIPGTIPVTRVIAPPRAGDPRAVTDPTFSIDGLRSVADAAERDTIPAPRRRHGMLVFTRDTEQFWVMVWVMGNDLSTWTEWLGGAPGSKWYDGTGAPAGALGVDGDYYLDDGTGDVYAKQGGAWGLTGNIAGPVGPAGTAPAWYDGPTGPPAVTLGNDGDYYLATGTGGRGPGRPCHLQHRELYAGGPDGRGQARLEQMARRPFDEHAGGGPGQGVHGLPRQQGR
jgi:hypothetical protein